MVRYLLLILVALAACAETVAQETPGAPEVAGPACETIEWAGTPTVYVTVYTYTPDGQVAREETDFDGDGLADSIMWRDFDELGRVVAEYSDGGQGDPPDGRAEVIRRFGYDGPERCR